MNPFIKVILKFASAQGISNVLRLVSGLIIVKLVSPEVYGSFTGPGIYLTYFLLLQLGINNGLSRELPFELGTGNHKLVDKYASVGLFINGLISIITFLVFIGTAIYLLFNDNQTGAIIYGTYGIVGLFNLLNKSYLPVLYRTNNDFDNLSKIHFAMGWVNIASVLFVYFFGLIGLCIRMVFMFIIEFILLFKHRPIKTFPRWSWTKTKKLLKVGIPIYLVGHVNILWNNVLSNIVLVKGGAVFLGYYALSIIVKNAIGIIPNSIAQVVYPKMSILLGEGKPVQDVLSLAWTPTKIQILLLTVIAVIGILILPSFVNWFLPKYSDGILAAQWMFAVPVVQGLGLFMNIYNVVQKQLWYFIALAIGALIGSIYTYIMCVQHGFALHYFPQGLILGIILQTILAYFLLQSKVMKAYNAPS